MTKRKPKPRIMWELLDEKGKPVGDVYVKRKDAQRQSFHPWSVLRSFGFKARRVIVTEVKP